MGAFGILGALAGGAADAAAQERKLAFERQEAQRGQQLGLTKLLLESPNVPAEYKPHLMQFGLDTLQTKAGAKLPSFDKLQQSLPAIQRQGQVQSPATTLQMPTPPPDANGVQLPAPPPATLPATQQTVTNPVAAAGQFHMYSPQEMAQHEAEAQNTMLQTQIQGMRAQGFTDEQIANKLGMSKLVGIPFGGLYNSGTGEVISPTQTPVHQGRPVPVDKSISPTGWAVEDIDRSGNHIGWRAAAPPTAALDTTRTSTTADEFGFKQSTTGTTHRQAPGVVGAGAGTKLEQPQPPAVGAGQGTAQPKPAAAKPQKATQGASGASTPTASQFTGSPAEKRAQYNAYKDQLKLTGTTKSMVEAAPKVAAMSKRLRELIGQQQQTLGPAASRWSEFWSGKVGAPNPDFRRLMTNAGLLETQLMRMHVGARGGEYMMQHFKDILAAGKQSPENMLAALDEIDTYANDVAHTKSQAEIQHPSAPNTQPTNDPLGLFK